MNNYQSQRGAVAVIVGLVMVVLIGFIGLAIDFGYAYVQKNRAQNVADAEALACVISPTANQCPSSAGNQYPEVNIYNFAPVVITNPGDKSLCPDQDTQNYCAKAEVTAQWNTFFIGLFGHSSLSLTAVAIAGKTSGGPGCIIASNYFNISGSQGINGTDCSNYFGNVSVNGNPPITGTSNYIYNGYAADSCSSCQPPATTVSGPLTPPALADTPYKPTVAGAFNPAEFEVGGSASTNLVCKHSTTCTLGPGLYNGLDCSKSQSICRFVPTGTSKEQYTFAFDGTFKGPANNGSLVGNKVLVYFGGTNQTVSLSGGGQLTLSSPALVSGSCSSTVTPESQIVIYAPNTGTLNYNGNVVSNITGNIYVPNFSFGLGGNGDLTVAGSVVVSAYTDNGGGNSGLSVNGGNACGFTPEGTVKVILVD